MLQSVQPRRRLAMSVYTTTTVCTGRREKKLVVLYRIVSGLLLQPAALPTPRCLKRLVSFAWFQNLGAICPCTTAGSILIDFRVGITTEGTQQKETQLISYTSRTHNKYQYSPMSLSHVSSYIV